MKTIWKYTLEIKDIQLIKIPKNSEILAVQTQNEKPCLWLLAEPEKEEVDAVFRMYGTGHTISGREMLTYIDTFQVKDGSLVFHVFKEV